MASNLEAARQTVDRVRSTYKGAVIDPTMLDDISGWSQSDYHEFWVAIIEKYARIVVFVDGWQYSSGCSIELVAAYRCNLEVLDQDLNLLDERQALLLLTKAAKEFEDARLNSAVLKQSAIELVTFFDKRGRLSC
jgi:hypothetical protein